MPAIHQMAWNADEFEFLRDLPDLPVNLPEGNAPRPSPELLPLL
jgi:hypothetical protein